MASTKRVSSVCHSIAHHAVSGLSYVHPHLLAACRNAGVDEMTLDLLDPEPCPPQFLSIEPLRLSLRGLREKLETILTSEGFTLSDLSAMQLTFRRDSQANDDYCSICHARLVSSAGRIYEHRVDCIGRSLAI